MAFLMSLPFMFRSKVGDMKFSIPQSFLPGDIGDKEAPFHSALGGSSEGRNDTGLRTSGPQSTAAEPLSQQKAHTCVHIRVHKSIFYSSMLPYYILYIIYLYKI